MKVLSAQTDLGNATSVSNASVVRVFNSDSSNLLVTRKTSGGTTIGSFIVPTGEAVYCEKDYTDTLESSAAVKASKTAFSPMMSFVSQDSTGPTYTYSVSSTSLDEGDSFTTTVTTTNVDDGTVLYWELSGTNITSNDFSSGALTGSGTISNNTFNFSHTVSLDATTEGAETILVKVYSDSGRNTQVGNTVNVNVADTSLTRTYTTSLSVTTADEGDTFTTTMTTTNVANGTVLYWELSGTGIAAGDFSSGALTGSGTISSNTFNFSHTIAEDNSTEGTETVSIKFYSDSGRNTQVGSTATATINDTSVTPQNYSVVFDGSNDWLEVADSDDYSFGSGDFTIEFWVKPEGTLTNKGYVCKWYTSGQLEWFVGTNSDIVKFAYSTNGNGYTIQPDSGYSMQSGVWQHIAVARSGNDVKLFVDGIQKGSTHNDAGVAYHEGTNPLVIGSNEHGGESWRMDGKISNLRITKGQALYTSNFTPSTTPLTTTSQSATASNVKLLCCNKSTPTGNTVTTSSIVTGGNPTVSSGTVNGFTTGKVGFDGIDDRLEIADTTDFEFGSGDFTVEAWIRQPNQAGSNASSSTIVNKWHNQGNDKEWILRIQEDSGNKLQWIQTQDGNSNQFTTGSTNLANDTWYHVAAVGHSGNIKLFVNGTLETLSGNTSQGTIHAHSNPLYLGYNLSSNGQWMDGEISNLRITKGQALYTSNFTPSTSALTTTSQGATESNVKLLCCKSSSSATAADVVPSTITTNGNPASATYNPFSTTLGAVNFASTGLSSGTGESLTITGDSSLDLGSGAFTIEAWVKMNSNQGSNWNVLAASSGYLFGNGVSSWNIYVRGTDGLRIYESSGGPGENWTNTFINDNMFNNSSWTHIAWTRVSNGNNTSNNNNTIWINGVGQGSFSNRENSFDDGQKLYLGASDYNQNGTATEYGFDGSISNFRLTKGQALYTSNFTPSTTPLTTTSQGATASNVSVLGLQHSSLLTSFTKSPSTPTVIGTPVVTTGPF